jgi:transposase
VQPVSRVHPTFESYYLYGAVAPTTGESFFLDLPYLDAQGFQVFLTHFAHHYAQSLNVLVLDNGSFHTAHCLQIPANVVLVPLPPYSPELNPIERLWRDLKDRLSRGVFRKLPALRGRVTRLLHSYSPQMFQSLTGYPYFVHAVNGLLL